MRLLILCCVKKINLVSSTKVDNNIHIMTCQEKWLVSWRKRNVELCNDYWLHHIKRTTIIDFLVYHTDRFHHTLMFLETCSSHVFELLSVSLIMTLLQDFNSSQDKGSEFRYVLSHIKKHRGCPRLEIKQELLEYLLQLGFSCLKIADVLGFSFIIVRGRMNEFGLSIASLYSNITDCELTSFTNKERIPNCGYFMMLLFVGPHQPYKGTSTQLYQHCPCGI